MMVEQKSYISADLKKLIRPTSYLHLPQLEVYYISGTLWFQLLKGYPALVNNIECPHSVKW